MVGGTSFYREILKASLGRVSKSKSNTKSFLISKKLGFSSNTTLQLTSDTLRVS
jgi:hypothetical protein